MISVVNLNHQVTEVFIFLKHLHVRGVCFAQNWTRGTAYLWYINILLKKWACLQRTIYTAGCNLQYTELFHTLKSGIPVLFQWIILLKKVYLDWGVCDWNVGRTEIKKQVKRLLLFPQARLSNWFYRQTLPPPSLSMLVFFPGSDH